MIHFTHATKEATLYGRVAENREEKRQLETLVREVEYIAATYGKTGLYIVNAFTYKARLTVLMSLGKKESIEADDIVNVIGHIDGLISTL